MKIQRVALSVAVGFALLGSSYQQSFAKEPHMEFLAGLREKGYGDMAVFHLEQLKATKLPEELVEIYELELGLSKVIWAEEGLNAEQTNSRLNQAQAHLEAFLKANAKHEGAGLAIDGLANMLNQRGQFEIKQARVTKDTTKQKTNFEAARKFFVASRTWMKQSVDRYEATFLELKNKQKAAAGDKPKPSAVKRPVIVKRKPTDAETELAEVEGQWLQVRMNYAMLDFYQAMTHTDVAAKERKDLLAAAAKKFDDIYQGYRATLVGVYAHMWHGRSLDESGDIKGAIDLYEEVLAAAEGAKSGDANLEDLFAQVEMYRLLLLRKKKDDKGFASDAEAWLKAHSKMNRREGYQGIALELTKYQIEQSKSLTAKAREDAFRKINKQLTDITKIRSEYQQEAFILKRQYQAEVKGGDEVEIASFDEGLAVANEAYQSGRWADSATAFTKTLTLGDKAKDNDKMRKARFQLAYAYLMTGKTDDVIKTCDEIIKENPNDPLSPQAGALKVQAALQVYQTAKDKAEPLTKLKLVADEVIRTWKTRPEADDARIALGQAMLSASDMDGSLLHFDGVQKESERYPQSQFFSGSVYWRKYIVAKSNKTADPKQVANLRTQAADRIAASVAGQEKQLKGSELQLPKLLIEARLLKGEMELEAGKFAEAQALLDPLALAIVTAKPDGLGQTEYRQILAALRARVMRANPDDLAKTGEIADVLLTTKGTDALVANSVLIEYTKQIEGSLKKQQLAAIEAEKEENATKKTEAEGKAEELNVRHKALIAQMSKRTDLSLASSVYLAESTLKLEGDDEAKKANREIAKAQYEMIIKRAGQPGYLPPPPTGDAALIRVRSQLAGLLREDGKIDEALKQIQALIAQTGGKILDPLIEECRLLETQGEKDPAKLDEAINKWSGLRNRMSKLPKKPPEYYEIVLGVGRCMLKKFDATKDKEQAKQCEQMLRGTLALAPALNGPETVAKYNDLLDRCTEIRTGVKVEKVVDPLKVSADQAAKAGGGGGDGAKPMPPAAAPGAGAAKPAPQPGAAPAGGAAKPAAPAPAPAAGAKPAAAAPAAGAKPATPAPAPAKK